MGGLVGSWWVPLRTLPVVEVTLCQTKETHTHHGGLPQHRSQLQGCWDLEAIWYMYNLNLNGATSIY